MAAGRGGPARPASGLTVSLGQATGALQYSGTQQQPPTLHLTVLPASLPPRPISLETRSPSKPASADPYSDRAAVLSTVGSGRGPIASLGAGPLEGRRPSASTPQGGGPRAPEKMDVLAQTLKLSDLDFDEFEPETNLIHENQTQVGESILTEEKVKDLVPRILYMYNIS